MVRKPICHLPCGISMENELNTKIEPTRSVTAQAPTFGTCHLIRKLTLDLELWLGNSHCDGRDSADDIGIPRIADVARLPARMRRRQKYKSVPADFAPARDITISKFDEIDRAFEFIPPPFALNFRLLRIDLHKRFVAKLQGRVRLAHRVASLHGVGQTRRVRRQTGERRSCARGGRTALPRVQGRPRERR
jgi:hypothetical protein